MARTACREILRGPQLAEARHFVYVLTKVRMSEDGLAAEEVLGHLPVMIAAVKDRKAVLALGRLQAVLRERRRLVAGPRVQEEVPVILEAKEEDGNKSEAKEDETEVKAKEEDETEVKAKEEDETEVKAEEEDGTTAEAKEEDITKVEAEGDGITVNTAMEPPRSPEDDVIFK